MTRPLKITKDVHFRSMERGRKELREGAQEPAPVLGRVPRISRLLALALYMEDLCRQGEVADYAELARLAMVTRARMTQIMSLLLLAPDIQEEILYLPRTAGGRDQVREKAVRPIAAVPAWGRQRQEWAALARSAVWFDEDSFRSPEGTSTGADEGSVRTPAETLRSPRTIPSSRQG